MKKKPCRPRSRKAKAIAILTRQVWGMDIQGRFEARVQTENKMLDPGWEPAAPGLCAFLAVNLG